MQRQFILLLCAVAAWPALAEVGCPTGREPVSVNVLGRVFPVRVGNSLGTAFTMELDGKQYLVTAKHLLADAVPATIHVEIDAWWEVPVQLVGVGAGKSDVLVLAADRQLSVTFPVDATTTGLALGQSVRFLGFFPGLRTSPGPGYAHRGMPLVMGGVLAAILGKREAGDGAALWIDGQNNKGFSGGPVVYQPRSAPTREQCRWRIAGVVAGYVVERDPPRGNSGLLYATPIEAVRELVTRNPIGFEISPKQQLVEP